MWLSRVMAGLGRGIAKAILGVIVLGCIAISAFFAYQFGYAKAATAELAVAYGLAGGGLDLLKAALPIIAASSHARSKMVLGWAAFTFLTGMSLWCAFGTTAGQLAERFARKVVAQSELTQKQNKLDRLREDRKAIGYNFTRADAGTVRAAQATVDALAEQVKLEAGRGGCGAKCGHREEDQRAALTALTKAQSDKAITEKADELDKQIAAAEDGIAKTDEGTKKAAAKDVDPQATSLAKATGIAEDKIALLSHVIFAVGIEIGSGLGLWLVFGHGGEAPLPTPVQASPLAPAPLKAVAASLEPEAEEDSIEARKRFFHTCVFHAAGSKVPAGVMHGAYSVWCGREGIAPMGSQAFGTRAPWGAKKKIGGVVHYLNCGIAPGLIQAAAPSLRVAVDNTTAARGVLGRMATVGKAGA